MGKKQSNRSQNRKSAAPPVKNSTRLRELLQSFIGNEIFADLQFHGNIKWEPSQLVTQALLWSWQESKFVTDAFDHTLEACQEMGLKKTAQSYTSMMNALNGYGHVFAAVLRQRFQEVARERTGRHFEIRGWVPIAFDGSRATAPRSITNERDFCAPNYGAGKRAKYGKKKSKGMRRKQNEQNKPHPQAPQAWITMLWHMGIRLPWTWRLGPSNSSERDHVKEILRDEHFPENTLFCGDAGFTGYPLWSQILSQGYHFLVRIGANVKLLSEHADIKQLGRGIVLCWPKGKMDSGEPPLRLRLVRVQIGKTKMWLLTSVLDHRELTNKMMIRFYEMRWGIEVEFRGLKQTIDKHLLRCRNSDRLFVELDWSLRGMAVAELLALIEQVASSSEDDETYDPKDRSLANTMRALRYCLRNLHKYETEDNGLMEQLSQAFVQRYHNKTDKRARYRPKNPDKKPLGDPTVRKLNAVERKTMNQILNKQAA
jgi:hypothetical protein